MNTDLGRAGLVPRVYDSRTDGVPQVLPVWFSRVTSTNAALGGYWSANWRADGDEVALFDLVGLLSKRVDVKDKLGRLVWQGLLSEVDIHVPGYSFSYALDEMANAVKVVYSGFEGDGEEQLGQRYETDWATNADGISTYGRKEIVKSIAGAAEADAELLRDRYLQLYDQPLLSQRMTEEYVGRPYAWCYARGYYWTCEWQVYNQSATGSRATNTQIEDIVTADCPFLASTDVVATGNSTERKRDANNTAWREILRLVALGDSSNNPLNCGVWEDRELVVEVMPTTVGYRKRRVARQQAVVYTDGDGAVVDPWLLRAGRMLRLGEVVPGAATFVTELDDPRNVFVERVSYSDESGVSITPLDAKGLADSIIGTLEPWR